MAIEEGKKAPAFTLTDENGAKVSLSSLSGKDVVLYFYPKDDTPGCTKEACGFRDLWRQIQKLGVVVLGVSPDGATAHQKFRAKYALPFSLLSDPERGVMTKYRAFGEDGVVRKHWPRVAKAETHPAAVLEALQAKT